MAYSNAHTSTINNQWTQYNQQAVDRQQGRTVDSKQQNSIIINANHKQNTVNVEKEIRASPQANEVVKTISGQIVKKTVQTLIHITEIPTWLTANIVHNTP